MYLFFLRGILTAPQMRSRREKTQTDTLPESFYPLNFPNFIPQLKIVLSLTKN